MCGLIGFSSVNNYDSEKIKFLLFWNSVERGKDATGVFTPETGVIKDNIEAKVFINKDSLTSNILLDKTLIGHVRAKTVGANSVDNAHPFAYGDVVMAHNGTLENHLSLCKQYNLKFSDFGVDSKVLAKCLATNFELDTKLTVLEQYEGAAALLFYNKLTDSLYAFHDTKRPLYYGYFNETDMYISSIKESLEAIHCEDITEFEVGVLHEIVDGKIISKTKYNPCKKSNFLEIILAGVNDIVYRAKKNKFTLRSKKENISGLDYCNQKPEYLKGHWIMCDTHNNYHNSGIHKELIKNNHLLIYGKWYFVLGRPNGEAYRNSELIEVKSSDGANIICTTTKFNLREFIPQVDKFVVALYSFNFNKTGESLCKEGDLMIVKDYEYGRFDLTIESPVTGRSGFVNLSSIRIATKTEVEKYLAECNASCEIDFPKTNVQEEEKKEEKKEDPKQLLGAQNSTPDKEIFDTSNLSYSYEAVCNMLVDIQQGVAEVTSLISEGRMSEAIKSLKQFEDDLILLYDTDMLDQFIPDDEYEMYKNVVIED